MQNMSMHLSLMFRQLRRFQASRRKEDREDGSLLTSRLCTAFRFILRTLSHSSGRRRSCEGSVPIRCPRCRTISQSAPSSMPPPWRWRATTGRSSAAPGRTCTWEPLGRSVCRHSRSCWAWRMLTNVFCDDIGLS